MTTTIRGTDNSAAAPALTGTDSDTGVYFPAADTLGLVTGGTEAVRVDSSGNVGINTSSPTAYAGYATLALNGTTGGILEFKDDDAQVVRVGNTGADLLCVTTGYFRMSSSSGGIQFGGDTAAANALDDYEEGTWTPVVSNGYTGVTYTEQNGFYTKVGRLVNATCYIRFSGTSNANNIRVESLPFAGNPTNNGNGGTVTYWDVTADGNLSAWINSGTQVIFYKIGTTSPAASTGNVTNKYITFSITYFTA